MSESKCEISACENVLGADSYYDSYYKKRICPDCFSKAFQLAKDNGFGEWFEKNYNKADYPPEFWKSVGAFVDLSKTNMDPYAPRT